MWCWGQYCCSPPPVDCSIFLSCFSGCWFCSHTESPSVPSRSPSSHCTQKQRQTELFHSTHVDKVSTNGYVHLPRVLYCVLTVIPLLPELTKAVVPVHSLCSSHYSAVRLSICFSYHLTISPHLTVYRSTFFHGSILMGVKMCDLCSSVYVCVTWSPAASGWWPPSSLNTPALWSSTPAHPFPSAGAGPLVLAR